jgi:hypothetical protein
MTGGPCGMMGGPGGIPPLASLRGFKSRTLTLMFFLVFFVAMFVPLSCYWLFAQSVAACGTRAARAARDGFGIARNTAATFDVFLWLQVTNFDMSLLHSAPSGPDHIEIKIFVLCLHDRLFRSSVRFRMAD